MHSVWLTVLSGWFKKRKIKFERPFYIDRLLGVKNSISQFHDNRKTRLGVLNTNRRNAKQDLASLDQTNRSLFWISIDKQNQSVRDKNNWDTCRRLFKSGWARSQINRWRLKLTFMRQKINMKTDRWRSSSFDIIFSILYRL